MENFLMKSKIINGYNIFAFKSKEEFLNLIKNEKKILVAMNAEKLLKEDEKLKNIVNNNIGYPDGVGAVMALKQKGLDAVKIPGTEFWLDIIQFFGNEKTFYLIGSSQDIIQKTVRKLKDSFPFIKIVGYRDGFLKENDKENLKKELLKVKPDVVFVAQGSPRQEFLMGELQSVYPALYMGLGGSFDVYTGLKKRAPEVFINLHLEWFYRLLKEPTRISRQLVYIKFIILLKMGKL